MGRRTAGRRCPRRTLRGAATRIVETHRNACEAGRTPVTDGPAKLSLFGSREAKTWLPPYFDPQPPLSVRCLPLAAAGATQGRLYAPDVTWQFPERFCYQVGSRHREV